MSPDQGQPPHFADVRFEREDVRLDGVTFTRCTFGPRCRLIFQAEALPTFIECDAEGQVELVLGGPARRTLELLSMLYHEGGDRGREVIEGVVDQLRRREFHPRT